MARISGIDLPKNKRGEIGLTYIYGIGKPTAQYILEKAGVDKNIKVKDWNDDQLTKIRKIRKSGGISNRMATLAIFLKNFLYFRFIIC